MTARRPQYALLLLVILLAPVRARGADRFYTDLLTRGSQAYASAEYDEAARLLRIACFGFLEEPPLLLEGLLRLSLAHAANGDIDDFRTVFNRITDLERRFGVYSATELPESVRTAFETEAAARIPSRDLQALSLSTLSRDQSYEDLSGLPIKKRRAHECGKTRRCALRVSKQYPQSIVTFVKDFTQLFHIPPDPRVINGL